MIPFQAALHRAIRKTFQLPESSIFIVLRLPDRENHILVTNNKRVYHGSTRSILQGYISFLVSLVQVYYLQLKLRHGISDEPQGISRPHFLHNYLSESPFFHNAISTKLEALGEHNIRILQY